jgi:hypothetical protein
MVAKASQPVEDGYHAARAIAMMLLANDKPEIVKLKSAICVLVLHRFPPPYRDALQKVAQLLKHLQAEGNIEQILTCVIDDLSLTLPYTGRLKALKAVLTSSMDPIAYPWADTLGIVDEEWAVWGTPWLLAAEYACENSDFDTVKKYLESAHRLMSVARGHLRVILDKYGVACRNDESKTEHELFARSLLATHAPTLSNFADLIDCARRLRRTSVVNSAIDRCMSLHGNDPNGWRVLNQFDDLRNAGNLCRLINAAAAQRGQQDHEFSLWTDAAINYLRRSLMSPFKEGEENAKSQETKHYSAAIRLGESYAAKLRALRTVGDQEEHQRLLREAREFIIDLGQSRPSLAYTAQRQLISISIGEARRARDAQLPQSDIDTLVDRVDEDYSNLYRYASPKELHRHGRWQSQRHQVARWHSWFLLEFGRFEKAGIVAQKCDDPDIADIAIKYKRGSTREAIKQLVTCLERLPLQGRYRDSMALGYGQLLSLYIELHSERLRSALLNQAHTCLRKFVGLFIKACGKEIDQGDIVQAKAYLRAARHGAEDRLEPHLVHLGSRIGLAEVKEGKLTPDDVLAELNAAFQDRPALRQNPYCRSIFLSILARGAGIDSLHPNDVWDIATSTEAPDQSCNPYNLACGLLWQIHAGRMDGWIDRLLSAVDMFPDDTYFQELPRRLWNIRGMDSIQILIELMIKISSHTYSVDDRENAWIQKTFNFLPKSFFFFDSVQEAFTALVSSQHVPSRVADIFIEGFVKGQLDVWGDPDRCYERTMGAAAWIASYLPAERFPSRWAQWLGSQRGACEDIIVRQLQDRVEQLRHTLTDAENLEPHIWIKHLNDFFPKVRQVYESDTDEEALPEGAKTVLQFCTQAVASYNPTALDSTYWVTLIDLVKRWETSLPTSEVPRRMAQLWMQLHHRIEHIIAQRIIDVTLPVIHHFKDDLERRLKSTYIPPVWVDQFKGVINRTREYLDYHSWPVYTRVDLRTILEKVAYGRPFALLHRGDILPVPLWVIRPANPVMVNGDGDLLVEIVRSLLDNACRFTPPEEEGGWIWAEVRQEENDAVLEIINEVYDRVLSPAILAQLNDPKGKPFSGRKSTGYGTRLCYRIVQLHQGSLEYHNTGMGLSAEIRLPLAFEGYVK